MVMALILIIYAFYIHVFLQQRIVNIFFILLFKIGKNTVFDLYFRLCMHKIIVNYFYASSHI